MQMLTRIACKDAREVSCLVANLLSDLEPPCGACPMEGIVLCGHSPLGGPVTVRFAAGNVLEIEGDEELLAPVLERRERCGKKLCAQER